MNAIYRARHPKLKAAGIKIESGISKERVVQMLKEQRETLPVDYRDVEIRTIPVTR